IVTMRWILISPDDQSEDIRDIIEFFRAGTVSNSFRLQLTKSPILSDEVYRQGYSCWCAQLIIARSSLEWKTVAAKNLSSSWCWVGIGAPRESGHTASDCYRSGQPPCAGKT